MNKQLTVAIFGLSLCACSTIYAVSPPVNFSSFGPYFYLGGELGWAHSNWSDFTNLNADDEGVVYGGKIGYQATRRFGLEAGGFALPASDQSIGSTQIGTVNSWAGYGAATFRFPLFKDERLFLRGKAGAAYRSLEHDGVLYTDVGTGHYWTAILGASLNYALPTSCPLVLGIEYSNIFGSNTFGNGQWSTNGNINPNAAPAVQIVAATLSVAFKI